MTIATLPFRNDGDGTKASWAKISKPYSLKRRRGSKLTTQRFRVQFCMALMVLAGSATAFGQYLGFPTAGVPKGPDGKPNMEAPAPRTADGYPDFTGMYGCVTQRIGLW
jgi:hypothetical protein